MAEYVNGDAKQLAKGNYTVLFQSAGAGTAKLQIKDHSDTDSSYIDIPSASVSNASTAFNIELNGASTVKVVLTGDAKCFIADTV